jgi:IclR family transcriptional regulator, acetate operon repressor
MPPSPKCSIQVRDSGVQTPALDRALAVLEFISAHSEGVTQVEIRKGLGFTGNLVFRLTKALVAHGYVDREEPGPRFVLSRKLLTLAQPKREERSLVQLAREPMRWLRDATHESAHIGVRSGFECIVLDRVVGPHPFKCYVEAGAHGPLHAGAPGKVMLAFLPQKELEETLRHMPLPALTPHTITSRSGFAKHLAVVRQRGYAMDLGETVEGHHCVGAPVFDADGRPLASIWITAPTPRLSEADGERLAPHVIKAAQMITETLR